MDEALVRRLERRAEAVGEPKSRLAERLIDEGLRMEDFPGIVFRTGPAGRRASLAGGPDVWEVVADVLQAERGGLGEPVAHVASYTGLASDQIRLALDYHKAYPHEIDAFIRMNAELEVRVARREQRAG
jgi:hypothetical protein